VGTTSFALLPLLAALGFARQDGVTRHDQPSPPASIEQTYLSDCAMCHGRFGEGTIRAPSLQGVGAASVDYMLSTGRMPLKDDQDPTKRHSPAYSPDVIAQLVDLVAGFAPGGYPVPDPDIAHADVPNGGELYRLNCAACHQSVGGGGAVLDRAAPPLHGATAVQVAEAVRVGPGQMPAFGPAALSDSDVRDVAAYVTKVLQHPDDRGGIPIWRLGPVPEGAVAIVIGLGLLVLFSIWTEGRARRTSRGT
jgi:ubiquinol-cytochrome c reductase cytochrome c subunit